MSWSHLVQRGLGHGVILHIQPLLMAGELAENVGQSSLCVWELILECVVMLLLEDASWKGLLDEVLNWLQCRRRAADPHNHCVPVTKSTREPNIKQSVHITKANKRKQATRKCQIAHGWSPEK